MRIKAINPQVLLESVCYLVLGGMILNLVTSGDYLSYVTPRMKPYLLIAAIVLFIWAGFNLLRLFQPYHKLRSLHCFVLVLPIIFLILPHAPVSTAQLSANYIGGSILSGSQSQAKEQNNTIFPSSGLSSEDQALAPTPAAQGSLDDSSTQQDDNAINDENSSTDDLYEYAESYPTDLPGLDTKNKTITVSNEYFSAWNSELYMNMKRYVGYRISITGFVLKDPKLMASDEFVPARMLMSCCVADLTPVGLLCKYDKTSNLEAGSWVTAEGTVFLGKYQVDGTTYEEPRINVTKITPAEEVQGYIYP